MEGTIIKGISGFYYVQNDEEIIECKARGKFRFNELTPMVGDKVVIEVKNGKGVIERILPRRNELLRPSVSNVTQAFVVITLRNPDLNYDLLNKFLVLCEYNHIDVVVCVNKADLISEDEKKMLEQFIHKIGYPLIFLSAKCGFGLEVIKEKLPHQETVFCGPSGVGKSTLLNQVTGRQIMQTGEVSEKLGRGKHTTRHSEIVRISEGYIVDTPGFSSLELNFIPKEELHYYFPEFAPYEGACKFTGCIHNREPQCAVKEAVDDGIISSERYDFYKRTLEELTVRRNKK